MAAVFGKARNPAKVLFGCFRKENFTNEKHQTQTTTALAQYLSKIVKQYTVRICFELLQCFDIVRGVRPDCKVCCARRSSPRTFVYYVRAKYITYIPSAEYFARNCIFTIRKHSKCKMAICYGCKRQNVHPNKHTLNIFTSSVEPILIEILS